MVAKRGSHLTIKLSKGISENKENPVGMPINQSSNQDLPLTSPLLNTIFTSSTSISSQEHTMGVSPTLNHSSDNTSAMVILCNKKPLEFRETREAFEIIKKSYGNKHLSFATVLGSGLRILLMMFLTPSENQEGKVKSASSI